MFDNPARCAESL